MSALRRIVMVRHGETQGESSIRFHGSGDVPLSELGRSQLRDRAKRLGGEAFELVVASHLRRSWEGAAIVSGHAPVRLERDFAEVDFGRWEGLTADEIRARDPVLYADWQSGREGFGYPGGESRVDFAARVKRGLDRLLVSGATSVLLVGHKGVIRRIAEQLTGKPLSAGPELACVASVSRRSDGSWHEGRRGSDPEALASSRA